MAPEDNGNWNEYRRHVVNSLSKTTDRLEQIDERLRCIEKDLAVIRAKIYVAAATSAIIFSAIASVFFQLVLTP